MGREIRAGTSIHAVGEAAGGLVGLAISETRKSAALLLDMSTTSVRQPAGVPTGGQFAAKSNPEAELELEDIQPTRVVDPDGTESWWKHGELHRDDGPAVIDPDGTESWYQHGEIHRDGGPAIVFPDGTGAWYQHNQEVAPR